MVSKKNQNIARRSCKVLDNSFDTINTSIELCKKCIDANMLENVKQLLDNTQQIIFITKELSIDSIKYIANIK